MIISILHKKGGVGKTTITMRSHGKLRRERASGCC